MACGGLKNIFEGNEKYICKTNDEYVQKIIGILDNDEKYDFSSITNKYVNRELWKSKIESVYS